MLAILVFLACKTPAPVAVTEPIPVAAEAPATAMAFMDAKGQTVCPVMGDVTPADRAVSSTTWQGVTYYFCCDSCEKAFAGDPETYAEGRHLVATGIWPGGESTEAPAHEHAEGDKSCGH